MPYIQTARDSQFPSDWPCEIDWSHPLATNLSAAYLFNLDGGAATFDVTGQTASATQLLGQADSGFTVHDGRRCIRQAAVGSENVDYVTVPAKIKYSTDDPSYGFSVSIGAAHTYAKGSQASWLLAGTNNYTGGWNVYVSNTPDMTCDVNSGNGFGIKYLSIPGFNGDFYQTGKWFDLTLAGRYFDGEGKHRLYGNFNQNPEVADDETVNIPNNAGHTQHRLFRKDFDNHYHWGGFCSHVYFWDRRFLTEDERLWINAEPWAFLRPQVARTYFRPSEPAGAPSAAPWFFQNHIIRHRRGA